MMNVTLKNTLDVDVKVTEGNSGVYSERAKLPALQGTYVLSVNPNATYREYVLILLPDGTKIDPILSSDDVAEFEEIVIQKENGVVVWKGTPKGSSNNGSAPGNQVFKFLRSIFRL